MVRDLESKFPEGLIWFYHDKLALYHKVLEQQRYTKDKIYSLHKLHVKCIAKGKGAKRYEFGNKTSIAKTRKSGIIVGALAFEENLYDGDTLLPQIEQVQRITCNTPKTAVVDRGYRGRPAAGRTKVAYPKPSLKSATNYMKTKDRKKFRARASIEPVIGHIKHDHRMIRNYLSDIEEDKVNTILAATAFNLKKMLNRIKVRIKNILSIFYWMIHQRYFCPILIKL